MKFIRKNKEKDIEDIIINEREIRSILIISEMHGRNSRNRK